MKKVRKQNRINASSMADIAFLLLIFFLVTTTLQADKGILCLLPPLDPNPKSAEIADKEVLEVMINERDMLLVENKEMALSELRKEVIKHINNRGALADYSSSPKKAVVSIQNHKGTSYDAYIQVYNEIRAGYNATRERESNKAFGKSFEELEKTEKDSIRAKFPMKISEADFVDN